MGQSQSSTGAPGDAGAGELDLYHVLGVERDASPEEIKKAYRKKALELHPDKNYGNVEESTELFSQVQSAYEILSDPQERAWYDSHRDTIRHDGGSGSGGDGGGGDQFFNGAKITTTEELMGYLAKFGSSSIRYSDSPTGFFGGLRDIFEKLAREEMLACRWEGLDEGSVVDYPSFGNQDDDHASIRSFYAVWSSFSTKKSFSWKDVYRLPDAPDRRVRRLMEKENKRIRDGAIRQFNDAVRSLVAFAKKRDPRYKPTAQSETQRQETLREAAAAQAARSRAANVANLQDFQLPEWAQTENPDYDDDGNDNDNGDEQGSDESEMGLESFKCEVCRKYFKSENQFEAHERSKKHIKAVKQMQRTMRFEDSQFQLNPDSAPASRPSSPKLAPAEPDSAETEANGDEKEKEDDGDRLAAHDDAAAVAEEILDVEGLDISSSQDEADNDDSIALNEKPASPDAVDDDDYKDRRFPTPPQQKIGKAKQKRTKKAAQKAGANNIEQLGFMCAACRASFPSKTKLFNHIRDLGHAQPVPAKKKGR